MVPRPRERTGGVDPRGLAGKALRPGSMAAPPSSAGDAESCVPAAEVHRRRLRAKRSPGKPFPGLPRKRVVARQETATELETAARSSRADKTQRREGSQRSARSESPTS